MPTVALQVWASECPNVKKLQMMTSLGLIQDAL